MLASKEASLSYFKSISQADHRLGMSPKNEINRSRQLRPLPLHTVQLPEPPHFEQTDLVNIPCCPPFPLHLEHLPVPLQPLHSDISAYSFPKWTGYFNEELPGPVAQKTVAVEARGSAENSIAYKAMTIFKPMKCDLVY